MLCGGSAQVCEAIAIKSRPPAPDHINPACSIVILGDTHIHTHTHTHSFNLVLVNRAAVIVSIVSARQLVVPVLERRCGNILLSHGEQPGSSTREW